MQKLTAVRGDGESALEVAQRGGGSILFYEDFANGFDGNNGVGGWTVEDTGEGRIWQHVDVAGMVTTRMAQLQGCNHLQESSQPILER